MNKPIETMQNKNKDIVLFISSVLILSLATNLIATFISSKFNSNQKVFLIIGIFFLFLGFLFIKSIYFSKAKYTFRFEGGVLYDNKNGMIKESEIYGYDFNRDFVSYLRSFLNENIAFQRYFSDDKKFECENNDIFNPSKITKTSILRSVLELTVLHKLGLHLNSYFGENEVDESLITTITRDSLDNDVIKNKVLDSITKNLIERNAFADMGNINDNENIVYSTGNDGVIYEKLDIELPPKSIISRDKNGFMVIKNKLFDIKIIPIVNGCATLVSDVLMNVKNEGRLLCPNSVNVKLEVVVKKLFFIKNNEIVMYKWLDSFIQELEEYISIDYLNKKMNVDMLEFLKKKNLTTASTPTTGTSPVAG
jgi:hypothetical protein